MSYSLGHSRIPICYKPNHTSHVCLDYCKVHSFDSVSLSSLTSIDELNLFLLRTAMSANSDAAVEHLNAAEHEHDYDHDQESLTVPLISYHRSATNSTSQVAIVGSNVCPIESLDYESVFPFWFCNFLLLLCNKVSDFCRKLRILCVLDWWCRIFENEFFKQDWRSRQKIRIFQYIFMKWLLCFLVGLIVSLIGFCNNLAVENLAGIKFVVTSNMMLQER